MIYSFDQGKIEQPQALLDSLFKQTLHDGDETMTTLSQYLREQGFTLGREEGSRSATITIAKNLLQNGASVELVKNSTGLSDQEIEQLLK